MHRRHPLLLLKSPSPAQVTLLWTQQCGHHPALDPTVWASPCSKPNSVGITLLWTQQCGHYPALDPTVWAPPVQVTISALHLSHTSQHTRDSLQWSDPVWAPPAQVTISALHLSHTSQQTRDSLQWSGPSPPRPPGWQRSAPPPSLTTGSAQSCRPLCTPGCWPAQSHLRKAHTSTCA